MAWHYDVLLATYTQLSRSSKHVKALQTIHLLRIILDEGHALGRSR